MANTLKGLSKLAGTLLKLHNGNIKAAKRDIDRFLRQHRADVMAYMRTALLNALEDVWRSGRDRAVELTQTGPVGSPALQRAYTAIAESMYDWPLSFHRGLVLGDATRADIEEWLARRRVQLTTELTDYSWLREVARGLQTPAQTVREVYTPEQLITLRMAAVTPVPEPQLEEQRPAARGGVGMV